MDANLRNPGLSNVCYFQHINAHPKHGASRLLPCTGGCERCTALNRPKIDHGVENGTA